MPALFANTLHEAIVALGGDINWWTTDEIVAGLHEAGAVFVTIVLVRTLLKSKPFKDFDEHHNAIGFYRKLKGNTLLVQVRRPGAEPDMSRLSPWEPAEGETRGWRLRDELPAELKARLRAHLRLPAAEDVERAAPEGGAAVDVDAVRASARLAPLALPPWVVTSLATHGGWTAVVGTTAARYKRRGANDGRPIVEVNVEATAAAGVVGIAAKVFGHEWAVCDSGKVNESGLRRVLRVLGERSLCPGVGEGDVSPAARPGYSAVARHAVRNGAAELIARPASSFVIGARTGGVLENTEGELPGVAPGPRFRADDCALVDEPSAWTARRGGNASYCEPCARFLRSLISAATSEHEKASATAAGHAPSEFTNHALISHDSPSRVTLALVAGASRTAAANQRHRRTRAAVRAQVDDSAFSLPMCEASTKMVSAFEGLEKSEEFARCFEEGSVQR